METVTVHWHYDGDPERRHQTEIPGWASDDGEHAAAEVAKKTNEADFEQFIDDRHSMPIIITAPTAIVGRYEVNLEYLPHYTAYTTQSQIEERSDTGTAEEPESA